MPTNAPGSLGYTYPNPLQQRGKLWLFWRGGGWYPTFSYTENGRDWVPARELVRSAEGQRPYAKYVGDGETNIHGIYSNGHVRNYENSLYYFRYKDEGIFAANRRRIASLASVPLQMSDLDVVYKYSDTGAERGRTTSRSTPTAGRGSSTRAASAARSAATRSGTPTTTARSG